MHHGAGELSWRWELGLACPGGKVACRDVFHSAAGVWRCSAGLVILCRPLLSCLHLLLLSVSWSEHFPCVFPGCWRAFGSGAPCPPLRGLQERLHLLCLFIHFVPLNLKGMRQAESSVQVAHKARPPEEMKCGLEGD